MITLAIILLVLLGILSIIDWKFKQVPSIFLTGILFVTMVINLFQYFPTPTFPIATGLTFFVFAWLLYEADFIGGIADVKIITIIGLMLFSARWIFVTIIMIMLFGIVYQSIFRFVLKKPKTDKIPFIPCLFAVYVALFICGGIV